MFWSSEEKETGGGAEVKGFKAEVAFGLSITDRAEGQSRWRRQHKIRPRAGESRVDSGNQSRMALSWGC